MAKLKTYTVKSLSLGGLNGKIYNSGDLVSQDQLAAPVEDLIRNGFLVGEADAEKEKSGLAESDEDIMRTLEAEEKAEKEKKDKGRK